MSNGNAIVIYIETATVITLDVINEKSFVFDEENLSISVVTPCV